MIRWWRTPGLNRRLRVDLRRARDWVGRVKSEPAGGGRGHLDGTSRIGAQRYANDGTRIAFQVGPTIAPHAQAVAQLHAVPWLLYL